MNSRDIRSVMNRFKNGNASHETKSAVKSICEKPKKHEDEINSIDEALIETESSNSIGNQGE